MLEILNSVNGKALKDGFVGEVLSADFITPADLSTELGVSVGTLINPNENWLCVVYKGKILYIPKKPIRYNIDYLTLVGRNIVNGSRTIGFKGHTYKIRLLNEGNAYTGGGTNLVFDTVNTHGTEWNAIMYRLSAEFPGTLSGEGIPFGEWAKYTAAELGFNSGNGSHSIAWSGSSTTNNATAFRGYSSVRGYSNGNLSGSPNARGWRPVLELVS